MKTKFLVRFLNRAAHFEADIELVDVFASAVKAGALVPTSGSRLFEHLEPRKHPRLADRQATENNRKIAITHLKRTLCAAFIKDLYEDVTLYLTALIAGAARAGLSPDRLIGEHKMSLEVNDILQCRGWEAAVDLVSRSLFRRLEEEKSTLKLLVTIEKKLGLGTDATLRDAALPYLELRHLLIHADGMTDDAFCKRFPALKAKAGQQIALNSTLASDARRTVVAMVRNYDEAAVKAGIIGGDDLQP